MSISIIVPAYNAQATLVETVQSALQKAVLTRLIIVDDGSTDATLDLAKRLERAHPTLITVLTGPNQGVSAARNRGAEHCKSLGQPDWLCFLDSDDLLQPDSLCARLALADQQQADLVVCDYEEFGATNSRVRTAQWDLLQKNGAELACAENFWVPPAALLIRSQIFFKLDGFRADLPVIQDARLLFDLARIGAKFVHLPEIGARYRVLEHSLSRSNAARFWRDCLHNGQMIESLWRSDSALNSGLSPEQTRILLGIYQSACTTLFLEADRAWRTALAAMQTLNVPFPAKFRALEAGCALFGERRARSLLKLVQAGKKRLHRD